MFKMTPWQEFSEIWSTDGFGQPRTAASKVALIFYTAGLGIFMVSALVWFGIVDLFKGKK
jgi:hypothetical protein